MSYYLSKYLSNSKCECLFVCRLKIKTVHDLTHFYPSVYLSLLMCLLHRNLLGTCYIVLPNHANYLTNEIPGDLTYRLEFSNRKLFFLLFIFISLSTRMDVNLSSRHVTYHNHDRAKEEAVETSLRDIGLL